MAGVQTCKTRETKTVSTSTVHRKRAPANNKKVAIQRLRTKVVMARPTTTIKVVMPMDKVATIKARTIDKKLSHNQVETEP